MKHTTIPPITSRIFNLLQEKKITQSELANMIGTRQSTISGWKQNNNEPEAELLEPIAKALNVSLNWLITGKELLVPSRPEEQFLLEIYYHSNNDGKQRILEYAKFISEAYNSNK